MYILLFRKCKLKDILARLMQIYTLCNEMLSLESLPQSALSDKYTTCPYMPKTVIRHGEQACIDICIYQHHMTTSATHTEGIQPETHNPHLILDHLLLAVLRTTTAQCTQCSADFTHHRRRLDTDEWPKR